MREFRNVSPGDLSRGHLAAFLTDPLRTIRSLRKDGKKQPKFTLDFAGKNGRPWRDIRGEVFALMKGDSLVPNYQIFSPYYDALRAFLEFTRQHGLGTPHGTRLPNLAQARIRGNVVAFREHHQRLLTGYCQVVKQNLENKAVASARQAEKKEYRLREVEYRIEELCTRLPAVDANLSFYGYKLADDALAHWQRHGREEEKEAKAKRKEERDKRKREDAEEQSRKQARL